MCCPAGIGTARSVWSASRTGADTPLTVARQPGSQTSLRDQQPRRLGTDSGFEARLALGEAVSAAGSAGSAQCRGSRLKRTV